MGKYVISVSCLVLKECKTMILHRDMDLSRLMMHAQQIEVDKIKKKDRVGGKKRARSEQHEYS